MLSSAGPASISRTSALRSSLSLPASVLPAEPAPTMIKSKILGFSLPFWNLPVLIVQACASHPADQHPDSTKYLRLYTRVPPENQVYASHHPCSAPSDACLK